jgi:hypothetical protein
MLNLSASRSETLLPLLNEGLHLVVLSIVSIDDALGQNEKVAPYDSRGLVRCQVLEELLLKISSFKDFLTNNLRPLAPSLRDLMTEYCDIHTKIIKVLKSAIDVVRQWLDCNPQALPPHMNARLDTVRLSLFLEYEKLVALRPVWDRRFREAIAACAE